MNKLLPIVLSLFVFTLTSQKATAQWDLFADLLSQMDNNVYNQYFNNLGNLDTTWNVNQTQGNVFLHDLYGELGDPNPGGMLDSSYLFGINSALDTLEDHLPGGLLPSDADTLLGELEHIGDIFGENFDSLGGVFDHYQDSLQVDSMANWNVTIIGFDDLTSSHFDILQDTLDMVMNHTSPSNRPHDIDDLIQMVFNRASFPDLELAFGMQDASLKYYNDAYSATAKVIRIGSVPRFNHNYNPIFTPGGLPIEARWHVEASFLNKRITTSVPEPIAAPVENGKGFNPLLLFGDFAMMATPGIGVWGNTTFRIITSLGIEVGTYAPAHTNYAPPRTTFNKGYSTGLGPQAGAGFSMTTGSLVIYSLGTVAHGDALHCARPYKYDSKKFEVGMRYGDIINIRYTTGKVTWQSNDNRRAKINNQITVGVILSELHH